MQVVIERKPTLDHSIAMRLREQIDQQKISFERMINIGVPKHIMFKLLEKVIIA